MCFFGRKLSLAANSQIIDSVLREKSHKNKWKEQVFTGEKMVKNSISSLEVLKPERFYENLANNKMEEGEEEDKSLIVLRYSIICFKEIKIKCCSPCITWTGSEEVQVISVELFIRCSNLNRNGSILRPTLPTPC